MFTALTFGNISQVIAAIGMKAVSIAGGLFLFLVISHRVGLSETHDASAAGWPGYLSRLEGTLPSPVNSPCKTQLRLNRATLERLLTLPIDVITVRLSADTAATYEKVMLGDGDPAELLATSNNQNDEAITTPFTAIVANLQ